MVHNNKNNKLDQQPMNALSVICGFPVSNGDSEEIISNIRYRAANRFGGWVVTLNLEMLSKVNRDHSYRQLLDEADMYIADCMPVVWASAHGKHRAAPPIKERTTGVDIVDQLLKLEDIPRFAIIGGEQPQKTLDLYPGANQACRFLFDGVVDLSPSQVEHFADQIIQQKIEIVFVALGVPKQDLMAKALQKLAPDAVYIGVGGTFQMLSAEGRRAPQWMRSSGLEWFYRLLSEPGRLWKRYLGHYPPGALYLLKDTFLRRADDAAEKTPVK